MIRYLFLCIGLIYCLPATAQQLPLFTQYRENIGIINPAALSTDFLAYEHNIGFGASYRRQWVGLDSAPKTQTIRGEYIYDSGSFGVITGGHLINDQTGPTGFTGLYGRIGGIISDDIYDSGIAFGLTAGFVQYRIDITQIDFRDEGDILSIEDQAQLYPDVGLGVYFYKNLETGFFDDSQVYAGVSMPQVFGLDLEFKDNNDQFLTKRIQHLYGLVGWIKHTGDESFLESSAWVKYAPNAPVNVDFNVRYQMESNIWLGTGASTAGTIHVEAGFLVGQNGAGDQNFRIGYGFDYTFRSFGPYAGSTHELNVAYTFGN